MAGVVTSDGKRGRFITAPFAWMGGKVRQRRNLYPLFAQVKRKLYVEPFGGSGAVFVGKEPEANEVYNDANGILANFFTCLRDKEKVRQIRELCKVTPEHRAIFHALKELAFAIDNGDEGEIRELKERECLQDYPDDVAGAFAFFYAQNNSFGGCFLNSFAGGIKNFKEKNYHNTAQVYQNRIGDLDWFCARFSQVCVENLDCIECIKKYDNDTTFFYCDPPYLCKSSEKYSSGKDNKLGEWNEDKQNELIETLRNCKGSVIASCYANDAWESLKESGFTRKDFTAVSSVSRTKSDKMDIKRTETVYIRVHNINEGTLF